MKYAGARCSKTVLEERLLTVVLVDLVECGG